MSRPKKVLPVIQPVAGSAPVRQEAVRSVPIDGVERTVVQVEGMDCASCAITVEKSVSRLPGVHKATVNFAASRLDTEHDKGIALDQIEQAVRNAGFGAGRAE